MRKLNAKVWKYQTRLPNGTRNLEEASKADNWCSSFVGKRFHDWYSYGYIDGDMIYAFKDEQSLLCFKIKWS